MSDDINSHVARRLREARAGLAWTQGELALKIGVGQVAVSLWEDEKRRISISTLNALAGALGKPLAYFLDVASPKDQEEKR